MKISTPRWGCRYWIAVRTPKSARAGIASWKPPRRAGTRKPKAAIIEQDSGSVILASHDADFLPQIETLLRSGRRVGILCFREFLSTQLQELEDEGLEIIDLEYDAHAFQVNLPRIRIIDVDDFNPYDYL